MDDRRVLYFGLEVPPSLERGQVTHCPLIRIVPLPHEASAITAAFKRFIDYTHLLFTSKSAVEIFLSYAKHFGIDDVQISNKKIIVVGKRTAEKITHVTPIVAENETAEGVIELLEGMDLTNACFFWPHSTLSRPLIDTWLKSNGVTHVSCPIYTTVPITLSTPPKLELFDEIVFTSPSTIDAFINNYRSLPRDKHINCIGPITKAHLEKYQ